MSSTPDIYQQICDCLQLQNSSNDEDIITDLLVNGRQSLKKYSTISTSNPELSGLLKSNIIQTWDTILFNQPNIKKFYDEMKIKNEDLFNKIVEEIAENGYQHKEHASQILFLMLQLSFPYIAQMLDVLNTLWNSLTTDGIISLKESCEFIAPADLDVHLNYEQDETPLYLALRGYYKMKAAELFEKHHMADSNNLYGTAADAFTKTGWISGMEAIRSRIPPFLYERLLRSVSNEIPVQSSQTNSLNPDECQCQQDASSNVQLSSSLSIPEMISQQIVSYLQLNDHRSKDGIISDLFKDGRRMLFRYKALIKPEVFTIETSWKKEQNIETRLMQLLKEYTFAQLQVLLEQTQPILFNLIREHKDSQNSNHFSRVQTRFVEYGAKYTGSSFVLSFVIQLLFDGITDDCIVDGHIFARLFKSLTDKGIHSAEEQEYAKYIAFADLKEQIADEQSMLHLALRMYFHEEITHLFSQHSIGDRNQRYKLLAEKITKDGWLIGIESMKDKISEFQYNIIHQAICHRLQYLLVTKTIPINEEPITKPVPDYSSFPIPNSTAIQCPRLILDCEPNGMFDDMAHAIESMIIEKPSNNNNRSIWSNDDVECQFTITWSMKMGELEQMFEHKKLLNDSIEYIHGKYYNETKSRKERISTESVSKFVEFDSETLVQEWKSIVFPEVVTLGDECIVQTEGNTPSTQLNSSISMENFIYINKQRLIQTLSLESRVAVLSTNQKKNIVTKIQKELTENIFDESNILLMKKFCGEMHEHIIKLINSRNSIRKTSHELLENISSIIKQTEVTLNNELAVFGLKLSEKLLASIDSNTCLLLTILYYQQRKIDLPKQYADLDRNQSAFYQYFLGLISNRQE